MAYKLINASVAGSQEFIATVKSAGGSAFKTYNIQDGISAISPTGAMPAELVRGSFTLGSGYNVTTTPYIAYDCDTAGSGLLVKPVIANRGNSSFYFGTNGTTPSVANGMPIASGESYVIDDNVRQLWLMTAAGSTVVTCHADYLYRSNTP